MKNLTTILICVTALIFAGCSSMEKDAERLAELGKLVCFYNGAYKKEFDKLNDELIEKYKDKPEFTRLYELKSAQILLDEIDEDATMLVNNIVYGTYSNKEMINKKYHSKWLQKHFDESYALKFNTVSSYAKTFGYFDNSVPEEYYLEQKKEAKKLMEENEKMRKYFDKKH